MPIIVPSKQPTISVKPVILKNLKKREIDAIATDRVKQSVGKTW